MATSLLAQTAGDAIAPATATSVMPPKRFGLPRSCPHRRARPQGRSREQATKLAGVEKVLVAEDALLDHVLAETVATLIVSLACAATGHHRAVDLGDEERAAARRALLGRDAGLGHHQGGVGRHF